MLGTTVITMRQTTNASPRQSRSIAKSIVACFVVGLCGYGVGNTAFRLPSHTPENHVVALSSRLPEPSASLGGEEAVFKFEQLASPSDIVGRPEIIATFSSKWLIERAAQIESLENDGAKEILKELALRVSAGQIKDSECSFQTAAVKQFVHRRVAAIEHARNHDDVQTSIAAASSLADKVSLFEYYSDSQSTAAIRALAESKEFRELMQEGFDTEAIMIQTAVNAYKEGAPLAECVGVLNQGQMKNLGLALVRSEPNDNPSQRYERVADVFRKYDEKSPDVADYLVVRCGADGLRLIENVARTDPVRARRLADDWSVLNRIER